MWIGGDVLYRRQNGWMSSSIQFDSVKITQNEQYRITNSSSSLYKLGSKIVAYYFWNLCDLDVQ